MDDDGLRNWGYYEPPSLSKNLNLQLMSNVAERGTKSFLPGRDPNVTMNVNGGYHYHHYPRNYMVSEAPSHAHHHAYTQMNYTRDGWGNHTDKYINVFPSNPNYLPLIPESSQAHTLHMIQPPPNLVKDERVDVTEEEIVERDDGDNLFKKRKSTDASKTPKTKKSRKGANETCGTSVRRVKIPKNSLDVVLNGIDMDISGIPIPVCSCTSTPQQCYRWGCGGWQSACCTTSISMHPLPMSTKRRGARIAGRKMSQGAFKKVLEKLASEDYNFANPIDLRTHWAKHGTNKFVTIR